MIAYNVKKSDWLSDDTKPLRRLMPQSLSTEGDRRSPAGTKLALDPDTNLMQCDTPLFRLMDRGISESRPSLQ